VTVDKIKGYNEFELDVEDILKKQLPAHFQQVEAAPLTLENIYEIPEGAKGAYLLLKDGEEVYAGKTDAKHGFRNRLQRHFYSMKDRHNLPPESMSFKAVRIWVFSALDVESILITQLKAGRKGALPWNNSGFGSNDPGRRRDTQIPANFDIWHPINVELKLDFINAGTYRVSEVLETLADNLPYYIRYEKNGKKGHPEFDTTYVTLAEDKMSAVEVLEAIVQAFPDVSWQATIFHGRIILYKESKNYVYATYVINKFGVTKLTPHLPV
jgi:hypothetical protein